MPRSLSTDVDILPNLNSVGLTRTVRGRKSAKDVERTLRAPITVLGIHRGRNGFRRILS